MNINRFRMGTKWLPQYLSLIHIYAQENLTVRLSLAGKTAQEAAKIADQVYVTSPDDWATSSMKLSLIHIRFGNELD